MELRKLAEIQHSKKRREILQGFERVMENSTDVNIDKKKLIIKDEEYVRYFSNMKYYSITGSSEHFKEGLIKKILSVKPDPIVLDFACGNGENALYAASLGAKCLGIDISPEGIDNCVKNSKLLGLEDKCTFMVMDGENLQLKNNMFDLCIEYGALHHVELKAALSEISRVLKPDGNAIFVEALRHNPLIHTYRKLTPHLRTAWEVDHILGVDSIEVFNEYFDKVTVRYFHLISLILVPIRNTFLFKYLLPVFNRIDNILLKIPFISKFAWIMIVELGSPKHGKL